MELNMVATMIRQPSESLLRSQIREREAAERTVAELEKKGQTGLSIEEVETFLRALSFLRD
jgi:hypothetical protein